MVPILPFGSLPQAEAIRFLEQFIRVLRAGGNLSDSLTAALNDLEAKLNDALRAFRQARAAEQTTLLNALEEERDNLLTGINNICRGFLHDPDAATRTAAQSLLNHLQVYGGATRIIRQNVKAQTTSIQEVVRDWNNQPELTGALNTLGLQRFSARLAAANTQYDELSVARNVDRAERTADIDFSVKDKLQEARPLYDEVLTLLNAGLANARRNNANTDAWQSVVGAATAITEEFNALRSGRATRRERNEAEQPA